MNEKILLKKLRDKDQAAYTYLIDTYQSKIYNVLYNYVKDEAEAEDLTQEVFVNVFKHVSKFRGDSKLFTWIYSIATNEGKQFIIRNKRKPLNNAREYDEEILQELDVTDLLTPESVYVCDEILANIDKSINDLSADIKETLYLREEDDMSYNDICKKLDKKEGTIKTRVFRAREVINSNLKDVL